MKDIENKCRIVKENVSVDFEIYRNKILKTAKFCFKEEPARIERERLERCLRKAGYTKLAWGKKCMHMR